MQKVLSLETSKKLVEAGIVLETELYHMTISIKKEKFYRKFSFEPAERTVLITKSGMEKEKPETFYDGNMDKPVYTEILEFTPAPDIAELLEALPKNHQNNNLIIRCGKEKFSVSYWHFRNGDFCMIFEHKELTEALAQCLLWVKSKE